MDILAILLDGVPFTSVIGIFLSLVVALLCFLVKDAYSRITKRIEDLEKENADLYKQIDEQKYAASEKLNELNLNILKRLEEVKDKFNEYRK